MPKLQFLEGLPDSGVRSIKVDGQEFFFDPFCVVPQDVADFLLAPIRMGWYCSFRLVTDDPAPAPVAEAVVQVEEVVPEDAPAPQPKRPRGRPRKK